MTSESIYRFILFTNKWVYKDLIFHSELYVLYPLLYVLGAADDRDQVQVYNDACIMGSLSMTSYLFG